MSYLSPTSLDEACLIRAEQTPKVIAGCTDYFPARAVSDRQHTLLDLTRIPELRGIKKTSKGWRIGAMTTWTDIVKADLPEAFHALQLASREVGSVQIQNRGTLGGNICNASPAADGVPPLIALDAEVELTSKSGRRQVKLTDFITGVRQTGLAEDELLTALLIPEIDECTKSAFLKLGSRKYLVISIAMVAAVILMRKGRIEYARLAVGSCSPVAVRLPNLEDRLVGKTPDQVADLAIDAADEMSQLSPISDVRGTDEYRLDVVAELCRRTVLDACGRSAQ